MKLYKVTQKTVNIGPKTGSLHFHLTNGVEYYQYSVKTTNKTSFNLRCMHHKMGCKAIGTIATNAIVTTPVNPLAEKKRWQLCSSNTTAQLTNISNWGKIELKHDHICNQGQKWSRNGTTPTHHRRESRSNRH